MLKSKCTAQCTLWEKSGTHSQVLHATEHLLLFCVYCSSSHLLSMHYLGPVPAAPPVFVSPSLSSALKCLPRLLARGGGGREGGRKGRGREGRREEGEEEGKMGGKEEGGEGRRREGRKGRVMKMEGEMRRGREGSRKRRGEKYRGKEKRGKHVQNIF